MGTRDLPAMIDYVLNATGKEKVSYIGHSQGTTQMFMASSLMKEYFASKVNLFIALAPVVYMHNELNYGLKIMSNHIPLFKFFLVDILQLKSMIYPWSFLRHSEVIFCKFFSPICDFALHRISDREQKLDNMERQDVYYSMFPGGCGWHNFIHYGQIIHDGGFRRYDFGLKKNL